MLSVIVPNYNRAALIGETLDNLLRQTRAPDELIVVDDGSTDDSVREIERFGSRVTLIRQANAGPAAARNRGLAASRGALIQFFDSDDLCSLNKLEVQERVLETTGADFAYGPWLQARLEEGRARYPERVLQQGPLPPGRTPLAWFLRSWVIVFQCCLFRRSLLDRVGPYRTDLMPSEDSELLFRMLLSGARPVHAPGALVLYRLHDGAQICRGGMAARRRAEDWVRYTGIVGEALAAHPGAASRVDEWYWRRCQWDAGRALERLAGPVEALAAPDLAERALFGAMGCYERIRAGLGRRLTGTGMRKSYQSGPLTPAQGDQLRAIGYEPLRDPRVQG